MGDLLAILPFLPSAASLAEGFETQALIEGEESTAPLTEMLRDQSARLDLITAGGCGDTRSEKPGLFGWWRKRKEQSGYEAELRKIITGEETVVLTRQLLEKFFDFLSRGIEFAIGHPEFGYLASDLPWVRMTPEVRYFWNRLFHLTEVIEWEHRNEDRIYGVATVPVGGVLAIGDADDEVAFTEPIQIDLSSIGIDGLVEAPLFRFDPRAGMEIYLRPHLHFGGTRNGTVLGSCAVGVSFEFLVTDKTGRVAIGTLPPSVRNLLWLEGPFYHPYHVLHVYAGVCLNGQIDGAKSNALFMERPVLGSFNVRAELHRRTEMQSLVIPKDPRLRFIFWQLGQFFMRPKSALPSGEK